MNYFIVYNLNQVQYLANMINYNILLDIAYMQKNHQYVEQLQGMFLAGMKDF